MENLLMGTVDNENPSVDLFIEGRAALPRNNVSSALIKEISEKILRYLKLTNVTLSVIITDNAVIQDINKQYRGKDRPTDVISFAYREEPFPEIEIEREELGDIYISLEKAEEQAGDYGNDLQGEIKRLLVHGILHLVGYDHEKDDSEALKMDALEEEILNSI
jgi:probable rRNA maturation factor